MMDISEITVRALDTQGQNHDIIEISHNTTHDVAYSGQKFLKLEEYAAILEEHMKLKRRGRER